MGCWGATAGCWGADVGTVSLALRLSFLLTAQRLGRNDRRVTDAGFVALFNICWITQSLKQL